MLTQTYARPENSYAAAQRRARISKAQATAAAERERGKPYALSIAEEWAAGYELERQQEAAANRAKIASAIARYSEANLAEMRSNSCSSEHFCRNVGKMLSNGAIRRDDEGYGVGNFTGALSSRNVLPYLSTASVNSACCCSFLASTCRCASERFAMSCTSAAEVAWAIS